MDTTLAQQRCETFFASQWREKPSHDSLLLQETLTHKSYAADYPQKSIPYNERLEFLGDAILWALVASALRKAYPDRSEELLTLKKIYLVKEPTLAVVARDIGLWSWLRLWKWEEKSWWRDKDVVLADACEAWIAYLRKQFWRDVAYSFVETYIYPLHTNSEAVRGKSYKSLLQERAQKLYQEVPVYQEEPVDIEVSGNILSYRSRVFVQEKLLGEAIWSNKKKAQEEAAKLAYEQIETFSS